MTVTNHKNNSMKTLLLPNQIEIATLNNTETVSLYHEIFVKEAYLKNGVEVYPGDCVFDIGANIGMFSLFMATRFSNLSLFSFEPVPAIYKVLQQNGQQHFGKVDAHIFNIGLSDSARVEQFQFNSRISMTSGMYAKSLEGANKKGQSLLVWIRALLHDIADIHQNISKFCHFLIRLLTIPVIGFLVFILISIPLIGYLFYLKYTTHTVSCRLDTISNIIHNNSIHKIDLLKIDVEGSEWDVIMGIEEEDWVKCKQFVIEIHDIENRVEKMKQLFEKKGFHVMIDQPDFELLELMNIYTLYAKRKE